MDILINFSCKCSEDELFKYLELQAFILRKKERIKQLETQLNTMLDGSDKIF